MSKQLIGIKSNFNDFQIDEGRIEGEEEKSF